MTPETNSFLIALMGSGGIMYFVIKWYLAKRDQRDVKKDYNENEMILLLREENLKLAKEILELRKEMAAIHKELNDYKIKVQHYENILGITLDIISNLKSLNIDDKRVIDTIVKRVKQ